MLKTLLLAAALTAPLIAEDAADWTAHVAEAYRVTPDVVYSIADGYENKLDVYVPRDSAAPHPTVVYIHGGGWTGGTKESSILRLLPYLRRGFAAVNVEYRLARNALAPAAVADCRCALRWVHANAQQYGFDPERLVVTGHSAGGHLSLMTGMLDPSAGLDYECNHGEHDADPKVAAIINFYGITDVGDLLTGENQKSYAVRWLGSLAGRDEAAERVSPLTYVSNELPPILTIHGDADGVVPYSHATRLHEALEKKGSANGLVTVPGGGHGGFSHEESLKIDQAIEEFLTEHGLL